MRKLRHLINCTTSDRSYVEITARTAQSQFLLRPDAHLNSLIAGVLARAKSRYDVELYGHAFLSNHFHLLIGVEDAQQMKNFMNYLMSNIARKVNRYRRRSGPFWQKRYTHIEVAPDEESLVARLDYMLQQGVKEGLVASPLEWPGLHCAHQLTTDNWKLEGHWDDLTKKYLLEQAGKPASSKDIVSVESLTLEPLPCWQHLSKQEVTNWVLQRIVDITVAYAANKPLGAPAILRQRTSQQPRRTKRSYAPQFHCRNPQLRREWRAIYRDFLRAFYRAVTAQDRAEDDFGFPEGAFMPSMGFVNTAN